MSIRSRETVPSPLAATKRGTRSASDAAERIPTGRNEGSGHSEGNGTSPDVLDSNSATSLPRHDDETTRTLSSAKSERESTVPVLKEDEAAPSPSVEANDAAPPWQKDETVERVHSSVQDPDTMNSYPSEQDNRVISSQAVVTAQSLGSIDDDSAAAKHRRWKALTDRGQALYNRCQTTLDAAALQEAIECFEAAARIGSQDIGNVMYTIGTLALTMQTRFEQGGVRTDLDNAIARYGECLVLTPPGHPQRSTCLNNFANALLTRFGQAGDRTDLDDCISKYGEALVLTPPGHSQRSAILNNLSTALKFRFELVGDREDLDECITKYGEGLELRPPGHPKRFSSLMNLANVLTIRFIQVGDRADLDNGITKYREALELMPPGHPDRSSGLRNMATALVIRFEQVGDGADLDDGINKHRESIELTPHGHPDRLFGLMNLGNALMARFKQAGDRMDLNDCITKHREALELTPSGHSNRSLSLMNLANAHFTRFEYVGDRADLDDCITKYGEALELTPPGHPNRSLSLMNLANALQSRFEHAGDRADLDDSISKYEGALALRPPGHSLRSSNLKALALALSTSARGIVTLKPTDKPVLSNEATGHQERALQLLEEATSAVTGGPLEDRLLAALSWVRLSLESSSPSSLDAYRKSIELLQIIISTGSSLEYVHYRLSTLRLKRARNLAVDAAACAIRESRIEMALELLEQGRSLLLTQAGRYRTPVDDLESTLAEEFRVISAKMEASAMTSRLQNVEPSSNPTAQDRVAVYQRLLVDWTRVVEKIRTVPGFESFLLPTPFTTLQLAAVEGPVIVVNLSKIRSDAIIVLSHRPPLLVRLPDATPDLILGLLKRINSLTSQHDMKTILNTLWHSIVQPIATTLTDEVKLSRGSRIWWCPTGVASLLPLHAAGNYSKRGETLPDRFISSYTATLTSLIRARVNLLNYVTAKPDLFILGQSQDPTLPTIRTEIGAIRRIVKNAALLDGIDATRDSAVLAMTRHSWVHLACHGSVDEKNPFNTHFSLSDGPLTLLDIARQNIPHAYLAFLSSFHSAEGNRGTPDESLHLTAGVQFAGFRSVVGTLWAMDGEEGPAVAETFYSNLLGLGPKATNSPAIALHRAVAELRRRNVPITRWASFVHYGC